MEMEKLTVLVGTGKSNLGIFQQYAEEIEMGDSSASYISYPHFEKAVAEIIEREKRQSGSLLKQMEEVDMNHFVQWWNTRGVVPLSPNVLETFKAFKSYIEGKK
jgi:hypothetical protein